MVEAATEYIGLDARVWPTIRALLFRPGRLTQAYVLGRRQEYVRPLRIYITSSLIFFFLLALIDPLGRIRGTMDEGDMLSDSTMSAASYAAVLDSSLAERSADLLRQRQAVDSLEVLADSLAAVVQRDSLVVASSDLSVPEEEPLGPTDEEALSRLADVRKSAENARDDALSTENSKSWQRERWERETLRTFRPDSLILPRDLQAASQLVFTTGEGPQLNGPSWLFSSPTVKRLKEARTTPDRVDAGWALGREAVGRIPTVVFLLLPLFALFMKVLFIRRGWYYSEHLIFALHVHAFTFAVFSMIAVLIWASNGAGWSAFVVIPLQLAIPVYFLVAMKRVYAQGWIKTLVKSYFLSWMYGIALIFGAVLALLLATAMG